MIDKRTFYTIARMQNLMTDLRHTAKLLPADIHACVELPIEDLDSELSTLSQTYLNHVELSIMDQEDFG